MDESIKRRSKYTPKSAKNPIGYILGSVGIFLIACKFIPAAMPKVTGFFYKAMNTVKSDAGDDWGPVIERK